MMTNTNDVFHEERINTEYLITIISPPTLHMHLLGRVCPAGGRPPDRQITILWKLLSVCVALTERTDKTTHTNWVLQQPRSHSAPSLPKGQCVWLFLCSDVCVCVGRAQGGLQHQCARVRVSVYTRVPVS